MNRFTRVVAVAILHVACLALRPGLYAQESILVRAAVAPQDAYVGQMVQISVKVLTTEFFTQQPELKIPKCESLVILPDPVSKGPFSDQINGTPYSGVAFEFAAFPIKAGSLDIPPFAVTTAQMMEGKTVERHPTMIPLKVTSKMPPGAENLATLICTSQLTIEDQWSPALTEGVVHAKVGDAFTRTVSFRAPAQLGMLLPPLPDLDQSGLRVYHKPAEVHDAINRGDLVGVRIETATYVCQQAGRFELPKMVVPWWNTKDQTLEEKTLSKIEFVVESDPNRAHETSSSSEQQSSPRTSNWMSLVMGVLASIAVAVGGFWYFRKPDIERHRFAEIKSACRENSSTATYKAILHWIELSDHSPQVTSILDAPDVQSDPALRQEIRDLELALLEPHQPWTGSRLLPRLNAWRKRRLQQNSEPPLLPELNPLT